MSALPPPSQKSWWSRSKSKEGSSRTNLPLATHQATHTPNVPTKPKDKDGASSKRFNFVASAIGKKSKKPHLTIQDPPPPSPVSFTHSISPVYSQPGPSNAVTSATRSPSHRSNRYPTETANYSRAYDYEYDNTSDPHTISEPRTPSDHPRDRKSYQNSVMTFADPDPFAANTMIVPQFDQDPNRLSVYSDSSWLDPSNKRADMVHINRTSYGSSSSNSHGGLSDGQRAKSQLALSPVSPMIDGPLPLARLPSDGCLHLKRNKWETSVVVDSPVSPSPQILQPLSPLSQTGPSSSRSSPVCDNPYGSDPVFTRSKVPMRPPRPPVSLLPPEPFTETQRERRPSAVTSRLGSELSPISLISHLQRKASDSLTFARSQSSSSSVASPIMLNSAWSSTTSINSPPSSTPPTRPHVLIRKASSQRVNLPPLVSAPPATSLPPPPELPFIPFKDSEPYDCPLSPVDPIDRPGSSCSSISFASAVDTYIATSHDVYDPTFHEFGNGSSAMYFSANSVLGSDAGSIMSRETSVNGKHSSHGLHFSPSRMLKKAVSHQNMMERHPSGSSSISISSFNYEELPVRPSPTTKVPRKQRSFHHPHIPLPPLPMLRHQSNPDGRNSIPIAEPSPSPTPQSPPQNPISSPSQPRRRLFSGSSMRSNFTKVPASPSPTNEDDIRSVFSLDTNTDAMSTMSVPRDTQPVMLSFTSFGDRLGLETHNACIAPMWEEMLAETNNAPKRLSQTEAVDQHIISPRDMLKLEQCLSLESNAREKDKRSVEREKERVRKERLESELKEFSMSPRSRSNSIFSNRSAVTHSSVNTAMSKIDSKPKQFPISPPMAATPLRRPATANDFTPVASPTNDRGPVRANTASAKKERPALAVRPSTTQATFSPPISPTKPSESPKYRTIGLPPPRRARQATVSVSPAPAPLPAFSAPPVASPEKEEEQPSTETTTASKRLSVAPLYPLSPPPRRKPTRPTLDLVDEHRVPSPISRPSSAFGHRGFASPMLPSPQVFTPKLASPQIPSPLVSTITSLPLPPPPPSSFEKHMRRLPSRQSIMRKPSFLDIDDEDDVMGNFMDVSDESPPASPALSLKEEPFPLDEPESFLDLGRGKDSFDTLRDFPALRS